MAIPLYYNTVAPQLKIILKQLMQSEAFAPFRLVGGTALSLYYGHRMSVDIDLFTDAEYGSVDFEALDLYLRKAYLILIPMLMMWWGWADPTMSELHNRNALNWTFFTPTLLSRLPMTLMACAWQARQKLPR